MKVVKKTADGLIHLDVTASTAEVSEALNSAGIMFCNQMGVYPEQGKTPAQAASEQLGIKDLDSVVVQQAIESMRPKAISKHNITPAYMPQVKAKTMLRRGKTFQFEMDVMPKPSYELSSYDPISCTVEPYQEDEEAIDREIAKFADMYSGYSTADPKPIEKGDNVLIKIDAKKDGEDLPGLTTSGRTYTVGEGYMPTGFDDGIYGMEVGEVRTFTFEGPSLDANDREVMEEFEVTVEYIEAQKKVAPVIDDEWVHQNIPLADSLAELRERIGNDVNRQRRKYYEDYKRNYAASELSKRFEGSIADEIYEGMRGDVVKNLQMQVARQGISWEDFVKEQGGEQQVGMMLMLETRQQLVQGFSLDAYYRHFKLQFTEDDMKEVCATMDPRKPERVRQQMESAGLGYMLRESAERLCAVKHLVSVSDIKEKEAEPKE